MATLRPINMAMTARGTLPAADFGVGWGKLEWNSVTIIWLEIDLFFWRHNLLKINHLCTAIKCGGRADRGSRPLPGGL